MLRRTRRMLRAGTLGLLVSTVNAAFAPAPARAAYAGARHALRPGARAAGRAAPSRGSAVHLSCDHATRTCGVHAPSGTNAAAAVAAVAAAPTVRGVGTRAGGPAMVAPAVETAECGAGTSDGEMAKQYVPAEVEERLYAWWEAKGYFKPAPDNGKQCFVVSMPPPNVTGRLHMGHAMFVALEDIMARFHRMRGHPTLWLPGTDHAGIATQMLVERDLKSKGVERVALGREGFLDKVWEWKEEYGGAITAQIRRLGASCDWSRERFTLQPELCEAVTEAFVTLHERGLVYRGERSSPLQISSPDLLSRSPLQHLSPARRGHDERLRRPLRRVHGQLVARARHRRLRPRSGLRRGARLQLSPAPRPPAARLPPLPQPRAPRE